MQRRESKFTTKFHRWLKYNWDIPSYFEIKSSKENEVSIPFISVSEKQYTNLQVKKFIHKLSDFDRLGTPFDMICFSGKGYVVLYYWKRNNKEFFIIPVDIWLNEKEKSDRKSLTEQRCKEIGQIHYLS